MKESKENRVNIDDVSADTFEMLINFIYLGKVPELEQKSAEELLTASDKYQVNELKSICEAFLCSKLTTESAPNMLLLADSVNAPILKEKTFKYISRYVLIYHNKSGFDLTTETFLRQNWRRTLRVDEEPTRPTDSHVPLFGLQE